jgi:hypothetical protein
LYYRYQRRVVAKARSKSTCLTNKAPAGTQGKNESDLNADTCCLGCNFAILNYTNRQADFYTYDSNYTPVNNVPIVSGATAWTHPSTHKTVLLVLNESLYFGNALNHSLINPNQIQHNDID